MQQYIQTSLKGVSTKWFLCRGKGIEQIGWWCRRRQTEAYVRKGRHTERGGGNLTLSPQVSRFSQTRWRLWGVQEDQTGRSQGGGEKKKKQKKDVGLAWQSFFFIISSEKSYLKMRERDEYLNDDESHHQKTEKEMEALTSIEINKESWERERRINKEIKQRSDDLYVPDWSQQEHTQRKAWQRCVDAKQQQNKRRCSLQATFRWGRKWRQWCSATWLDFIASQKEKKKKRF